MPSTLSWLDASAEDQRRMREIVGLFSNTDSRDELGIGAEDAESDERGDSALRGLQAKAVFLDRGDGSRMVVGSANATSAA